MTASTLTPSRNGEIPFSAADDQRLTNPFQLDSDGDILKPEILLSDWIEMVLLFLLIVLGLPLNVIALAHLVRSSPFSCGGPSARIKALILFHFCKYSNELGR